MFQFKDGFVAARFHNECDGSGSSWSNVDPFDGRKDIQSRRFDVLESRLIVFRKMRCGLFVQQDLLHSFVFHWMRGGESDEVRKDRVGYLAIERVVAELEKIWGSSTPSMGLEMFWKYDLWSHLPVFRYWNWKEVSEQGIKAFDWMRDRFVCWSFLLDLGQVDQKSVQGMSLINIAKGKSKK